MRCSELKQGRIKKDNKFYKKTKTLLFSDNKNHHRLCVCVCEVCVLVCVYVGLVSSWLEKSYRSLLTFFRV